MPWRRKLGSDGSGTNVGGGSGIFDFGFGIWDFGFWISGLRFRISDNLRFQILDLEFEIGIAELHRCTLIPHSALRNAENHPGLRPPLLCKEGS